MPRLSFLQNVFIVVVLVVGMASNVQASIVDLTFSGNYEGAVSGPFSYSMTYDTSLDTNTEFFATGDALGGKVTTHPWYGYSASGIIDSDIEFEGAEFLPNHILSSIVDLGDAADIWFDVDLATGATPTLALIHFTNLEGDLTLGKASTDATNIFMVAESSIELEERIGDGVSSGSPEDGVSSDLTISSPETEPIPEPASVITWTLLVIVGCIGTWWNRRRSVIA